MRLSFGERGDRKRARKKKWHKFFPIFPRKISDHNWRWLEMIERRGIISHGMEGEYVKYFYRTINPTKELGVPKDICIHVVERRLNNGAGLGACAGIDCSTIDGCDYCVFQIDSCDSTSKLIDRLIKYNVITKAEALQLMLDHPD